MEREGFARTDRSQAIAIRDVPTYDNGEKRNPLRPEHRMMWMASPGQAKSKKQQHEAPQIPHRKDECGRGLGFGIALRERRTPPETILGFACPKSWIEPILIQHSRDEEWNEGEVQRSTCHTHELGIPSIMPTKETTLPSCL